ncbi:2'-5'-oligoadenylate synthase 2-like [Ptychodera flava]|uniref:2'-5'-oligoadenylate synthase 2-like n=1 Tax=Ptychodera flava TaxID=63121 RepID=UPI003969DE7C
MLFVEEEGTTACSVPGCGKRLKTHFGLLHHRFSKHPERYSDEGYSCGVCGKYYLRMVSGKQHERDKNHDAPKRRGRRKTKRKNFLQLPPSDLDDFIADNLQPTDESNSRAHDKVEKLVNFHHHNVGYSVKEIVVSGSFGKGTQVKGRADLDCVLILNDFKKLKQRGRIYSRISKRC